VTKQRIDTVFAEWAAARPDRVAVTDHGGSVSFGQLWHEARALAAALRGRGVRDGDAVALLGYSSRDSILGMLGILAAGAHYVPIDPTFPAERVGRMVELSGAALLLRTDDHEHAGPLAVPAHHVRDLHAEPETLPDRSADALAYAIFTSGSTGEPKPVGVSHHGITALALRDSPLRYRSEDCVFAHTTLAFDGSVVETWQALLVGASIVCAPRPAMSLREIAAMLAAPEVTATMLTPSIFAMLVDSRLDALATLRLLVVGGDVMPPEHAVRMRTACQDVVLVNAYGPTENSVASTAHVVTGTETTTVPIGTEIAGARCYVLDENLRPATAGELWVGGDRLADGYLGNPELTGQRFRPDPFSALPDARMYRTGDQVRLDANGELCFDGRIDDEVKVRGFRVNLAEARAALSADDAVREVVVLPVGAGYDRSIAAFVRPARPGVDAAGLRARAWQRAPRHVVPDTILLLDEYPLASNGKTDRDALVERWRAERPAEPGGSGPEAGDEQVIARLWQARVGAAPGPDDDFFVVGGTSLDLIRLVEDITGELAVELDFADVYGVRSFTELVAMVRDKGAS
jgi:nonribosomal peptide synthetase CepB